LAPAPAPALALALALALVVLLVAATAVLLQLVELLASLLLFCPSHWHSNYQWNGPSGLPPSEN
jgi:hypothetical protein